ncbi:MAG TPA: bifunctional oligoribonuclease/PAP phosphatase NrnA [Bacteroidetes bacterium]|nr:bifunctional oligoribonuclease/PAP phosphatase NrnA [Bacteroidota bacterium]
MLNKIIKLFNSNKLEQLLMKDKINFYDKFKTLIANHKKILLLSHQNPDGDAIGSVLAMYALLKAMKKEVQMILPDNPPDFLQWIKNADKIIIYHQKKEKALQKIEQSEIIICLDFNALDRLGEMGKAVRKAAAKKVLIDHHLYPEHSFDLKYSYRNTSSTAELVFDIINNSYPDSINKTIAEAVYLGIMTDTGSFNHNANNPETFTAVSKIMEYGINPSLIFDKVYNNYSYQRLKMLGYALENTVLLADGKAAYIYLSQETLKKYMSKKGDTEGFVNYPLAIQGVLISAIFIEKPNEIKISLRSKWSIPANIIASEYFQGGGHRNAAGGKNCDTIENTIKKYEKAVKEIFEKH